MVNLLIPNNGNVNFVANKPLTLWNHFEDDFSLCFTNAHDDLSRHTTARYYTYSLSMHLTDYVFLYTNLDRLKTTTFFLNS